MDSLLVAGYQKARDSIVDVNNIIGNEKPISLLLEWSRLMQD